MKPDNISITQRFRMFFKKYGEPCICLSAAALLYLFIISGMQETAAEPSGMNALFGKVTGHFRVGFYVIICLLIIRAVCLLMKTICEDCGYR